MKGIQHLHMFRIKAVLVLSFAIALHMLFSCGVNHEPQEIRPNIIWIYADDHDQQAISAYGSGLNQTPNIDRIALEGMIFRNSFVSNSICSPARAVIQTGKFSHLNGMTDNKAQFDSAQQTFPKLLQKEGYQTALIGKWHLRSTPSGFDYWNKLPGQGNYYDPVFIRNGDTIGTDGHVTDIVGDFALEYLEEVRNHDQPFMLMMQFKAPHGPWMPPPRFLSLYEDDTIPPPETIFADPNLLGRPAVEQDMMINGTMSRRKTLLKIYDKQSDTIVGEHWLKWLYSLLDPEDQERFDGAYLEANREFFKSDMTAKEQTLWYYQRYIKDYLRCIAGIDENVGRLLDYLDESGLAENTIVMYSSDQGFYLGEHGWYDKRFMYDKSMRTPLLARWPGVIPPGSETNQMVQNIDMAETILAVAGAAAPDDMQGLSLLPLMRNPGSTLDRDALYYHYYEFPTPHHVYPHYGIRTNREKLIYFYTIDHWEYYNLEADTAELVNRYHEMKETQQIIDLKASLRALRIKYKDNG